ncbi:MAG: hypothetical protein ABI307_15030 [Mycobacterium sp.]
MFAKKRRIPVAAATAAAGGCVLAAAFLQAAIAATDPGDSGTDPAGFTVGNLSFTDPVALPGIFGGSPTPGYESIAPLFSTSPLLANGSDFPLGQIPLGAQQFTVGEGATSLGTVTRRGDVRQQRCQPGLGHLR